jgi:hypothetical protein
VDILFVLASEVKKYLTLEVKKQGRIDDQGT